MVVDVEPRCMATHDAQQAAVGPGLVGIEQGSERAL